MRELCLIFTALAFQVVFLVSDRTPFAIEEVITRVPPSLLSFYSFEVVRAQRNDLNYSADVVFDYTYMPSFQHTGSSPVIGMSSHSSQDEIPGKVDFEQIADKLTSFLAFRNVTSAFLTYSQSYFPRLAAVLELRIWTHVVALPDELNDSESHQFVGRLLKPTGSKVVVLLVDHASAQRIVPVLQEFSLFKAGFVYILCDEAAWGLTDTGLIYVTDSVAVSATDQVTYEAMVLTDRLTQLLACTNIAQCLQRTVSLVNIVDGIPKEIHDLGDVIVFPGNTTLTPKMEKPGIDVWADIEGLSFDGSRFPYW